MLQYFAKNQPNIQRDAEKKCVLCNKDFRFGRAEHQCKRCLRAVCADCGKEKITVYKEGFARRAHRGCTICVEDIAAITEYIRANRVSFGSLSLVGEKWMKKIQKNTAFLPGDSKKANEFKKEVFGRMWDSYNYSMREFIGLLTFQRSQEEVYITVNSVVKAVLGVYPQESLEPVAYLSIFLLCFCPADKAILICLNLLELKDSVMDSVGLVNAYLTSLGMGNDQKIREFMNQIVPRFTASLSVNHVQVNSSVYLMDKIIGRRKIDEMAMFLVLSVDVIKDTIINGKNNHLAHNLLLVRHCSPNSISYKYRQLTSVNSSAFMKSEEQGRMSGMSLAQTQIGGKELQPTWMTSSFNQGMNLSNPLLVKDKETVMNENRAFQKKYAEVEGSQDAEESLSMISMIEEMKDLQRPQPEPSDGSGQLLAMLSGTEFPPRQGSENQSAKSQSRSNKNNYSPPSLKNGPMKKQPKCQKCKYHMSKTQDLQEELRQLRQISNLAELLKGENEQLKEQVTRLKKSGQENPTSEVHSRQNELIIEKHELDGQLRRQNQLLMEYQMKEKEFDSTMVKYDEATRIMRQQEAKIKALGSQFDESSMTISMLKNKLESQSFKRTGYQQPPDRQSESTDSSTSDSKVIDILKQNVKDKNVQIEELTKRNKLLAYQLEDLNRISKTKSGQLSKAIQSQGNVEKEAMVRKLNELSKLLMNEEGEKLRLSEQNFDLRQILKDNKVRNFI